MASSFADMSDEELDAQIASLESKLAPYAGAASQPRAPRAVDIPPSRPRHMTDADLGTIAGLSDQELAAAAIPPNDRQPVSTISTARPTAGMGSGIPKHGPLDIPVSRTDVRGWLRRPTDEDSMLREESLDETVLRGGANALRSGAQLAGFIGSRVLAPPLLVSDVVGSFERAAESGAGAGGQALAPIRDFTYGGAADLYDEAQKQGLGETLLQDPLAPAKAALPFALMGAYAGGYKIPPPSAAVDLAGSFAKRTGQGVSRYLSGPPEPIPVAPERAFSRLSQPPERMVTPADLGLGPRPVPEGYAPPQDAAPAPPSPPPQLPPAPEYVPPGGFGAENLPRKARQRLNKRTSREQEAVAAQAEAQAAEQRRLELRREQPGTESLERRIPSSIKDPLAQRAQPAEAPVPPPAAATESRILQLETKLAELEQRQAPAVQPEPAQQAAPTQAQPPASAPIKPQPRTLPRKQPADPNVVSATDTFDADLLAKLDTPAPGIEPQRPFPEAPTRSGQEGAKLARELFQRQKRDPRYRPVFEKDYPPRSDPSAWEAFDSEMQRLVEADKAARQGRSRPSRRG